MLNSISHQTKYDQSIYHKIVYKKQSGTHVTYFLLKYNDFYIIFSEI